MRTLLFRTLLLALPVLPIPLFAQDDDGAIIPEERKQEIKAQRAAFLTQRLDLSPEEAQKFWPVYNQYDKEIEAARKEQRDFRKGLKDGTGITESEANTAIDRELAARQKELDIRKKYAAEFKKTLGAVKTLELGRAEHDFNRELIKRVRDRIGERRDGPGGPGRPGGRR